MVSERKFRRNNQRWSAGEFDRLLRSVKLEDVTPPVERFYAVASALERTPHSVRGMWLQLRDAGLRGRRSTSPVVAAYVRERFPVAESVVDGDESLDSLIAAYQEARRRADALLERVFALAGSNGESLAAMRQSLLAATPAARPLPAVQDELAA